MASLNIYLNFPGNCEEAFAFYQKAFGVNLGPVSRYSDMPPLPDGPKIGPGEESQVMHVALPLPGGSQLMGCDVPGDAKQNLQMGTNFSISLAVDSRAEADRLYQALSEGGKAGMPMQDQFWGDYFGMLTDPFGIGWMINCPAQATS